MRCWPEKHCQCQSAASAAEQSQIPPHPIPLPTTSPPKTHTHTHLEPDELAGVVTNLLAGLMGARWGIKTTLLSGLCIQLAGLGMMFGWQVCWPEQPEPWKWRGVRAVVGAVMVVGGLEGDGEVC